ncbi:MAG: helix-turn-helix transcriptional regulator [Trueperaceae bacterium]|nr:helix-turn-helix transcriptional regulator [Trueperaceae bacterium]
MPKRPLKRASDLTKELLQDPEYATLYHDSTNEEIGAMLRAIRESRGLSQREVAEKMGVSRSRISQIEGVEGTNLALSVLRRYVYALGCRFDISVKDIATGDEVGEVFVPELPDAERDVDTSHEVSTG